MLLITYAAGNRMTYYVSGKLSREELLAYYTALDAQYAAHGRLRLLVRVHAFQGYAGPGAWLVFLTHEHKVLRKVGRYAAVTELTWFRGLIAALNWLVPGISLRACRPAGLAVAEAWLDECGI